MQNLLLMDTKFDLLFGATALLLEDIAAVKFEESVKTIGIARSEVFGLAVRYIMPAIACGEFP